MSINKKKIAIVTGSRAEYGLLSKIIREIHLDPSFDLQLIVTGMHLSPEFGSTYKQIENDGFPIAAKIEMLLSSDSSAGVVKSMGLGLIGFADQLERLQPDFMIVLGDRFEILAAAQAAMIYKIPIAHIHGGELTEGSLDDMIRHAISKMAHLHFVAAEPYRKRLIQMGENPEHIINVGALGLERIANYHLLNKSELAKKYHFSEDSRLFLLTYHPDASWISGQHEPVNELIEALKCFDDVVMIFTKANADEGGRRVNQMIERFVESSPDRVQVYDSLGDVNYLSLMQAADLVIGNSSSGIIEAPYFGVPTVNIGNRQKNRLKAKSIIDCGEDKKSIKAAIEKALSSDFNKSYHDQKLPYPYSASAKLIIDTLKNKVISHAAGKPFFNLNMDRYEYAN